MKKYFFYIYENTQPYFISNPLCKITFEDDSDNVIFNVGNCNDNSLSLPMSSIRKLYFKSPVSIETETSKKEFIILPSPATDYIKLYFSDILETKVSIFDTNGQLVKYIESVQNEDSVSITDLTSGVYFVVLSSSNKTVKFIKL